MNSERTEERLDAVLAALRARPARLDEITRARVGARLEAALAQATDAEARTARGWRRGVVAAGVGLAAAAAVLAVIAVARDGEPAAAEPTAAGAPSTVDAAGHAAGTANVADTAPASGDSTARAAGTAPARAVEPVTVAAGESAQLTLGGAAITVYGPGRLSPTRDGAAVEAAGIVVDRARGDTPWSVRYHGIEIVATRATFAIDRGAGTRVTVMRGELVLRCPSGSRTIRSGASATCEPAAKAHVTPAPPPPASPPEPPRAPVPQPRPEPAAIDPYSAAELALRRGDHAAARAALLAILDASPGSLEAATALLDLARLAASRGEAGAAVGYLDRLDLHPRRAALAAPAARLREVLARPARIRAGGAR